MQDVVRSRDTLEHRLIVREVAPDDADGGSVVILCELLDILLTVPCQKDYVENVGARKQFPECVASHIAGVAGEDYCFIFHCTVLFILVLGLFYPEFEKQWCESRYVSASIVPVAEIRVEECYGSFSVVHSV